MRNGKGSLHLCESPSVLEDVFFAASVIFLCSSLSHELIAIQRENEGRVAVAQARKPFTINERVL